MEKWITSPVFIVEPPGWGELPKPAKPVFEESDVNKKLYGVELAKGLTAYEAAKAVFPEGQGVCVWVAQNWIAEPVVIAAKDEYLQAIDAKSKNLDKEQFLAKVMDFYDATYEIGGTKRYVNEGKDRLAALKLYAEAKGFVNKNTIEIDNSKTTNNFVGIKLVKAEPKEDKSKVIELPNTQSKISNSDAIPQLKLVGGVER